MQFSCCRRVAVDLNKTDGPASYFQKGCVSGFCMEFKTSLPYAYASLLRVQRKAPTKTHFLKEEASHFSTLVFRDFNFSTKAGLINRKIIPELGCHETSRIRVLKILS